MSDENNKIEFKEYYNNSNIYLISALGTGKTELLNQWINSNFSESKIVYVSFRKSLTDNITSRLNLISYEDINGPINLNKTPWIACQIESINWIVNIESCKLFIYDEIDSILTHVCSNKNVTNDLKIDNLIKILKCDSTKIFLDGYINQNTINVIQSISNNDHYIIHNSIQPRLNENINLHNYSNWNEDNQKIIE